jgi:PilZ domain-containing protein
MQDTRTESRPVTLDVASLQIWGLQGSGYSARLIGEIDDLWAVSFTQAQHAQDPTTRFYLDQKRHVLVFTARAGEDPQRILAEARSLVGMTNDRAGRQAQPRPAETARPTPDDDTRRLTPRAPVRVARMEDTRGSARVGASLMVQFRAGDSLGLGSPTTGMTRDLSETGVFILTNRLPSVGERLNLTFHLAAQKRMELTGEVVRVLDKDEARRLQLRPGFGTRVTDSSGHLSLQVLRSQI